MINVLYATGIVTSKGLMLHALRPVRAGRYTLTIRYRQGHKQVITRSKIRFSLETKGGRVFGLGRP